MKNYTLLISNENLEVWWQPEKAIIRAITHDSLTASKAVAKLLFNNVIPSIEAIVISDELYSTLVVMIRGEQLPRFLRRSSDELKVEEKKKTFASFLEEVGEL